MDEEKFEKMVEMMKGFCKDEKGMTKCHAMIKKMMQHGEGKEAEKNEKDTEKTG